jgi:hypothetical protein
MEEDTGNRNDSHSTNHLTDNASTAFRLGGIVGFAGYLPDTTYLYHATNAALETGDIDWTIAGWVALNKWTDYYTIISKYPTTANEREYVLYYYHDIDVLEFTVRKGDDSGYVAVDSTVPIAAADDSWFFYVIGHDSVNNQIFISVNNETLVTAANTAGMHVGNGDFIVGGNAANLSGNFEGWVDQIGFWKRVLTSDERTWLYNSGVGRSYAEITTPTFQSAWARGSNILL